MSTIEKSLLAALVLSVTFLAIFLFQVKVTCAPVCESRDMRATGASMPPWGSEFKCLCEPQYIEVAP